MSRAVELAHELINGDGPASRRVVFLHGLLGRGSNLRTLARRFLQQRPGWDALLVDLRGHGASPKGSPNPTITEAAGDVRQLCCEQPPTAIIGHSFGGKVALNLADLATAHVVTLDSNPGPKAMTGPGSPGEVLPVLRSLPDELPNRTAFVGTLTARGLSLPLAQWLSMSTEPTAGGGVRFALDLGEVAGLWASHQTTDLWPVVSAPPPGVSVHLVIAERSAAYDGEDRTRAGGRSGSGSASTCWPPTTGFMRATPTRCWLCCGRTSRSEIGALRSPHPMTRSHLRERPGSPRPLSAERDTISKGVDEVTAAGFFLAIRTPPKADAISSDSANRMCVIMQ